MWAVLAWLSILAHFNKDAAQASLTLRLLLLLLLLVVVVVVVVAHGWRWWRWLRWCVVERATNLDGNRKAAEAALTPINTFSVVVWRRW